MMNLASGVFLPSRIVSSFNMRKQDFVDFFQWKEDFEYQGKTNQHLKSSQEQLKNKGSQNKELSVTRSLVGEKKG